MKNTTLRDLRTTLVRHPSELARGAARHAALQPYPDGEAVLAALALDSPLSPPERDALVRALVVEAQRSRHGLWSALLILAFQPAMAGLRKRARRRVEDADAVLMQCVLESIASIRPDAGPVVLALYRGVAKRFFRHVRAKAWTGDETPLDERRQAGVPWHREPDAFVKCAAGEVLRACETIPGATSALLEELGEAPIDHGVEPVADRERQCDRRLKRRRRLLARVREVLHPEAHATPSSRGLGRCRQ